MSNIAKLIYISRNSLRLRNKFIKDLVSTADCELAFKRFSKLEPFSGLDQIDRKIEGWKKLELKLIPIFSKDYPEQFRYLPDPPLVIYALGDVACLTKAKHYCGIVGARNADAFGRNLSFQLAKKLAQGGVNVVSGLAYGIDASAHAGAIQSGSEQATIAILGNGLPNIYPSQNFSLAKKILANRSIVISQFEPDTPAFPQNFLNRNRLIAALSENLIVIQASNKSGSLVTARSAGEQGKSVWVVPGDISNPRYRGSNKLIQDGAGLITCMDDLINLYPELERLAKPIQSTDMLSQSANQLLSLIEKYHKVNHEKLLREYKGDNFHSDIIELESKSLVNQEPGGIYSSACTKA